MYFRVDSVHPKQINASTDDGINTLTLSIIEDSETCKYISLKLRSMFLLIDFNVSGTQLEQVFFGYPKLVYRENIIELKYVDKTFEVWINKTLYATLARAPNLSHIETDQNLTQVHQDYRDWMEKYFPQPYIPKHTSILPHCDRLKA